MFSLSLFYVFHASLVVDFVQNLITTKKICCSFKVHIFHRDSAQLLSPLLLAAKAWVSERERQRKISAYTWN
jgi:hypothetical protein